MPKPSSPQPESHAEERQPAFSFSDPADTPSPGLEAPGEADRLSPPTNRFYAIARDPHSLFVYWELNPPTVRIPGAALALVIHRADGSHETTCNLDDPGGTRVIDVTLQGTSYSLALGYLADGGLTRDDMDSVLAELSAETPRNRPVASGGPAAEELARLFPLSPGAASSSSTP